MKTPSTGRRGAALLLTLSVVLLLSALVLAFLPAARDLNLMDQASVSKTKANWLAETAVEYVLMDLDSEIRGGSEVVELDANQELFLPRSPQSSNPQPSGLEGAGSGDNIIKVSRYNESFWEDDGAYDGVDGPIRATHEASTSDPSLNRLSVAGSSWDKPLLTVTPDAFANGPHTPPDWVLITRAGVPDASQPGGLAAADIGTLADSSPDNEAYVLGRFAYVVYDLSGLLDVNVAGRHSQSDFTESEAAFKGSVAAADLTVLPKGSEGLTQDDVDTLLAWRQPANHQDGHLDALQETWPDSGFMEPADGDQRFAGRQDLIAYWQQTFEDGAALPFLTTFSRTLDAPSFSPQRNPSDYAEWGLFNPQGETISPTYNYRDEALEDGAANPNLLAIRVESEFTRRDGSTAEVGDPLVSKRFDLDQLALIEERADESLIGDWFGLAYDGGGAAKTDGVFIYDADGNGTPDGEILTLSEVAALNSPREPNFFELLKAGILHGSLGKHAGDAPDSYNNEPRTLGRDKKGGGPNSDVYTAWNQGDDDFSKDLHIIQIGANIIDQYDADSFPVSIEFSSTVDPRTGVEDLPYFARIYPGAHTKPDEYAPTPADPDRIRTYSVYFQPELWNPHQPSMTSERPSSIRLQLDGEAFLAGSFQNGLQSGKYGGNVTFDIDDAANFRFLKYENPETDFREPEILRGPHPDFPEDNAYPTEIAASEETSNPFVGWRLGPHVFPVPDKEPKDQNDNGRINPIPNSEPGRTPVGNITSGGVTFYLEAEYPSGAYRPYDIWNRFFVSGGSFTNVKDEEALLPDHYARRLDPRTERFGAYDGPDNSPHGRSHRAPGSTAGGRIDSRTGGIGQEDRFGEPLRLNPPNIEAGFYGVDPGTNPVWHTQIRYPALFADNKVEAVGGETAYYWDRDGVVRRADGAYAADNDNPQGRPLLLENRPSRPVMLNRPFKSAAELGYAHRDLPWKHLDFFTVESADLGLLDLFTVGSGESEVRAGVFNPNHAPAPVLASMLRGTQVTTSPERALSAEQAEKIADAIVETLESDPELLATHPGDISVALNEALDLADLGDAELERIKAQRESLVRAFAGPIQTRTWNLMIDLVVQSGRFPAVAGDATDFVVAAETRYWYFVAIDRPTGRVVEVKREAVYE
ncbi:MAG: hypothetical protein AAGK14_04770 [Verrucomicrobiota bacterium]